MKKLYVLCIVTLLAVILDVTLFHSRSVEAQPGSTIHIEKVSFSGKNVSGDAPVTGKVLGFNCIDTSAGPQCFIASGFGQ